MHPFPAKMAPELVSAHIERLPGGVTVLDPMMGSGTFPVAAAAAGHKSVGLDSDPLAVVIARASVWDGDEQSAVGAAHAIAHGRRSSKPDPVLADPETRDFVDYWFDQDAQKSLAAIVRGIEASDSAIQPVLWCAFSRLIIAKDAGDSKARDVSHSRPHVVRAVASFDPLDRFEASLQLVLNRRTQLTKSQAARLTLRQGDARSMPFKNGAFSAIMTSPPYLTAIDYLRGHRMSLVWMGHSVSQLRSLRGSNIGSERGMSAHPDLKTVKAEVVDGDLAPTKSRVVNRYLMDLRSLIKEVTRILAVSGTATFVVANSSHGGASVKVDEAIAMIAAQEGLTESDRVYRQLPANRRYLPPPKDDESSLSRRMRTETILTLKK